MTDESRKTVLWVVMVISIFLTAITIYDLVQGESTFALWVGVICWPIVAICTGYLLVQSGRHLHDVADRSPGPGNDAPGGPAALDDR